MYVLLKTKHKGFSPLRTRAKPHLNPSVLLYSTLFSFPVTEKISVWLYAKSVWTSVFALPKEPWLMHF